MDGVLQHTHNLQGQKVECSVCQSLPKPIYAAAKEWAIWNTELWPSTHAKWVIFNICLSSLACQLWACQAWRQAAFNSGLNCHTTEIYSNRGKGRDKYSKFRKKNMSAPPPVIQFCCCSLQVTNRDQGLLRWYSSSSFPAQYLEAHIST